MMATKVDTSSDVLSPRGLDALLRLLVGGDKKRIGSAEVDGRTVWIKRFRASNRSTGKWLHALATPMMPYAFLRSSPLVDATGRADREARKTSAFRTAGFPALDILYRGDDVLVFSNAGRIVRDEIARLMVAKPAEADALLVDCAEALGRAHAAGLAHGRPHPRDMFIEGDRIGFLDFEEEPEASMPLTQAQARDVWLLFQQIVVRAQAPDTADRAFAAYRGQTHAATIAELKTLIDFFGGLLGIANILGRLIGSDGQRMVAGTKFLKSALTPSRDGVAGELRENRHD